MDYVRQYKSFTNSHYFTEGLRLTIGILIPAFTLSFFDLLPLGILMSFGALCVSLTDNPGPVHHRRNGMLACTAAIFIMSILALAVNTSVILTGLLLAFSALFFSMLGVFGARPGSIGLSALIVLTLHIDNSSTQVQLPILQHALLITAGALWYTVFSMLLHIFRPYKLAQQAMGDWMQTIALYLHTRAKLYNKNVSYPEVFQTLFLHQAAIQEKQTILREILLKTRAIVRETTPTGHMLLITFIHMSDVFEKIITSYSRYSELHKVFDETVLLEDIHELIDAMAYELEGIGIAIKSGSAAPENNRLPEKLKAVVLRYEKIQLEKVTPENLETFISLKRTFYNIEDIIDQLQTLQQTVARGKPDKKSRQLYGERNLTKFLNNQPIARSDFIDNLSLKSDIFRHSLRITIALVTGFIVAHLFNIGHGYWILLTILVILKPAYSLSKKRNRDRLFGTVAGVVIGLIIIHFVVYQPALLVIMVVLMAANFSLMRTNYMVSVMLMTPYILIFFYILQPQNFSGLLKDRVIDTVIGSVIAFAASMLLFPAWEKYKIQPLLVTAVEKVKAYFSSITAGLGGKYKPTQQRLARKDAFIALANISDAFNRMLNEPKYQQKNTEELQRFVVLLHSLVSYIATLGYYIKEDKQVPVSHPLLLATSSIQQQLQMIIETLNDSNAAVPEADVSGIQSLDVQSNQLLQQRLQEIEFGQEETPTKIALYEMKSIAQQFKLINRSVNDIRQLSLSLNAIQ